MTPTDTLNESLQLLHQVYRRIVEEPDEMLAEHGLSRVHHRILYQIARAPGLSVGTLVANLGVTKQALNRPLRKLLADGYVESRAARRNRRVKELRLTERGTWLENRVTGAQRTRLDAAFQAAGAGADASWNQIMRAIVGSDGASRTAAE